MWAHQRPGPVAFVVLVLVPSARPDDGPKKANLHAWIMESGTHEGPGECQTARTIERLRCP